MDDTINWEGENPVERTSELEGAICDLEARLMDVTKALEALPQQPQDSPAADFDATVAEIKNRDNCSRTDALAKARVENPDGFEAFQSGNTNADYDALCAAEMAKGCSLDIAAQRVLARHPHLSAQVIAKKDKHPFEALVAGYVSEGMTPNDALAKARKDHPNQFNSWSNQ